MLTMDHGWSEHQFIPDDLRNTLVPFDVERPNLARKQTRRRGVFTGVATPQFQKLGQGVVKFFLTCSHTVSETAAECWVMIKLDDWNIVTRTTTAPALTHVSAQYNLSVEYNQNVESKRQSLESKIGKWGVQIC